MTAVRLVATQVAKPWGRRALGAGFAPVPDDAAPVGEIWFRPPAGDAAGAPELLVKYLFTAAPLSVQVHPDDAAARAAGHARGKDEAWLVLAAEPDAVIGFGLRHAVSAQALRDAADDGTIATLIDWRPVAPGALLYSAAGTIHAIGAGLTLVEIQQNADLTYRLFDYDSDRPLHRDAAVAVARRGVEPPADAPVELQAGRHSVCGPKFCIERWRRGGRFRLPAETARPVWIVPLAACRLDGASLAAGEVWLLDSTATLDCGGASDVLIAYPGTIVLDVADADGD